jgi:hypothetical protein
MAAKKTTVSVMSSIIGEGYHASLQAMCDAAAQCEDSGGRVEWLQSSVSSMRTGGGFVTQTTLTCVLTKKV